MKHLRQIAWLLLIAAGFISCKSSDLPNRADSKGISNEQQQPLSYFNIYRGNNHSHTIYTWTHGEHRDKGINDLSKPTEFHPDWPVPPGVDWRDHNSINLNPEYYTKRQGLPENHFELAIANGYDFYAITDHTQEPNLQPVSQNNKTWKALLGAVEKYSNRKDFVPIVGFEYSRNTNNDGGSGHINVLNSSEYVNADHGQRGPAPAWPEANWSIPKFYSWVKSAKPNKNKGEVVVGFNHPGSDQYDTFNHIDPEIAKRVSTFEIHTNYKQNRWKSYITALNKGWRLSPIGVHDNHGYTAINNKELPPPTFVLAPELTLEAITHALRERRTFASWNTGVELKYAVNGYIMGSILENADRYNFNIEVKTPSSKPDEQVKMIRIYRDKPESAEGVEIVLEKSFDGNQDKVVWTPSIDDTKAKYFLFQVFHENDLKDGVFKANGSTISAPVWTGR